MLALVLKILSWVTGALPSISGMVQNISNNATAQLASKTAASVSLAGAASGEDAAVNQLKAQQLSEDRGWWLTALEKPILFYLCLLHFGAIMLDSTFKFHWGIPKPPPPYDQYEGWVLMSDVLFVGTSALTQRVITSIWK